MEILGALVLIGALTLVYLIGYITGRRHERAAQEEASERLLRLDPPDRTPGLPTNITAAPSTPRQPRWRNGRFGGESQL
jgi:hypothetical protein